MPLSISLPNWSRHFFFLSELCIFSKHSLAFGGLGYLYRSFRPVPTFCSLEKALMNHPRTLTTAGRNEWSLRLHIRCLIFFFFSPLLMIILCISLHTGVSLLIVPSYLSAMPQEATWSSFFFFFFIVTFLERCTQCTGSFIGSPHYRHSPDFTTWGRHLFSVSGFLILLCFRIFCVSSSRLFLSRHVCRIIYWLVRLLRPLNSLVF